MLPGEVLVRTRGWGPGLRTGDCLPLTLLNMQILTTLLVAQAEGCCILMDRRDVPGVAEDAQRVAARCLADRGQGRLAGAALVFAYPVGVPAPDGQQSVDHEPVGPGCPGMRVNDRQAAAHVIAGVLAHDVRGA